MGVVKTYIKISKGVAEANDNKRNGLDFFAYGKTTTNPVIYFCDVNTVNTHPEILPGQAPVEYVDIDHDNIYFEDNEL